MGTTSGMFCDFDLINMYELHLLIIKQENVIMPSGMGEGHEEMASDNTHKHI